MEQPTTGVGTVESTEPHITEQGYRDSEPDSTADVGLLDSVGDSLDVSFVDPPCWLGGLPWSGGSEEGSLVFAVVPMILPLFQEERDGYVLNKVNSYE